MIQKIFTKWQKQNIKPCLEETKNLNAKTPRLRLARAAESFAGEFLRGQGWEIKETNWRSGRFGEIDIIATDPTGTIVFVEVKARRISRQNSGFIEAGFNSINERKRKKILLCAACYLAKHHRQDILYRFDAIILHYLKSDEREALKIFPDPAVHYVENVF